MPNDCWNNYTFISDDSVQLQELFDNEILSQKIPEDCLEIVFKGPKGIKLKLWSPWRADLEWFKTMLNKYSKCWIKNEWVAECGTSGVFVGGPINGKTLSTVIATWAGLSIEAESYYLSDCPHIRLQ